ncbi:5'-tyrosyl-DNA phosphodiesterase [Aphelenchoides bicaudatus]|nr:5'-tyrosyl-DNA phosphodiesterase [Aphelenchoides bicaudatus]
MESKTETDESNSQSEYVYGIPRQLTAMSYNIDGLDDRLTSLRLESVFDIIKRVNPDVLFLQKVVKNQENEIRSTLSSSYKIFSSSTNSRYYVLILVRSNIRVISNQIVRLERSLMDRNFLFVEAKWNNLHLKLINTHLESCAHFGDIRKQQFYQAIDKIKKFATAPNVFGLFGGDLNLEDGEASHRAARGDTGRLDRWRIKRGDGIYLGHGKVDFWLEGKERTPADLFPSDHFAIVSKFTDLSGFEGKNPKKCNIL